MKNYRNPSFAPSSPSPLSAPAENSDLEPDPTGKRASNSDPTSPPKAPKSHSGSPKNTRKSSLLSLEAPLDELLSSSSQNPNIPDDDAYDYSTIPDDSGDEAVDSLAVPPQFLQKLATFLLFQHAPKPFHTKIASKLKLMQYHPQEYIIREGDPAMAMYWILKGTVSVTSTDGEAVYAELASGSYFGEIGILFNRPRTATVVARTKVLVGVLTSDALNVVLKLYPLIERRIRDEAQERLAMQDKRNRVALPHLPGAYSMHGSDAHGAGASNLAHASAVIPGPSIPPVASATAPAGATSAHSVDRTISVHSFLKSLPIFTNLPSHIVHRLALGVEPLHYQPFEYIFRKGDEGADIYFVVSGEVEVIDSNSENCIDTVLARVKAGSYFGEMSFLAFLKEKTAKKRSASIRLVSQVELLVVRSGRLESLCAKYPFIVKEMTSTAAQRNSSNSKYDHQPVGIVATPPRRLSINFLVNEGEPNRPSDPVSAPTRAAAGQREVLMPQPLFLPLWGFGAGFSAESRGRLSRSISPVSYSEPDSPNTLKTTVLDEEGTRKRPPSANLEPYSLIVPPLNAPVPSLHNFQNFPVASRRPSFQYMPHNKRLKLATLGAVGRRRSSVLSNNGPLPDRILLMVFEYLSLPDLMRLRAVSQRWRQLLYVAPNLCKRLDLTPWNTQVTDKALKYITDFVGSRPTYINISNCFHVTDEGFTYLVNEIGMAGSIKVLKMRSNWDVSAMAIMDLAVPSVGRFLEEIDLSNCRKVRDNVLERLIGWDPAELVPEDGELRDVGCKNLKILNVGYCKHLTDNVMFHIANHANKRLESLNLTRCTTITDKGFQFWTYRLFPALKKVLLKDCTFLTDKAIIAVANAAPNLEILDLNFCCALSDIAVEILCLGCQNLRELDLLFCGLAVSDSLLVAISLHLRNLEKLILKGCVRVTRAGIDALLSGCLPLTYINVSQCRNAHMYPGRIPAQRFNVNPQTKLAFVTAGSFQNVIEIVI